jgi:hypothetical protein
MDLNETGEGGMNLTDVDQVRKQWSAVVSRGMNLRVS